MPGSIAGELASNSNQSSSSRSMTKVQIKHGHEGVCSLNKLYEQTSWRSIRIRMCRVNLNKVDLNIVMDVDAVFFIFTSWDIKRLSVSPGILKPTYFGSLKDDEELGPGAGSSTSSSGNFDTRLQTHQSNALFLASVISGERSFTRKMVFYFLQSAVAVRETCLFPCVHVWWRIGPCAEVAKSSIIANCPEGQ